MLSESPGGLLYDYGDIDQLCARLIEINNDRDVAGKSGRKNRQWIIRSKLSWSDVAGEYLATIGD